MLEQRNIRAALKDTRKLTSEIQYYVAKLSMMDLTSHSLLCRLSSKAEGKPCVLEQRHVKAALKDMAKSDHALAEGFALTLQNCQEAAILGSSVAFALRPAIVSPCLPPDWI